MKTILLTLAAACVMAATAQADPSAFAFNANEDLSDCTKDAIIDYAQREGKEYAASIVLSWDGSHYHLVKNPVVPGSGKVERLGLAKAMQHHLFASQADVYEQGFWEAAEAVFENPDTLEVLHD